MTTVDSTPTPGDAASIATSPAVPRIPTVVKTDVRGPLDFGFSAHGGSSEDCFAALIAALRSTAAAGLIGDAVAEGEAA
ncbi:MAG: hypothetical protein DYG90_04650 [Chloroflexi bacterium CFX6]|nr:hypothetical protein [Chloroflexi bacterium CFX6]